MEPPSTITWMKLKSSPNRKMALMEDVLTSQKTNAVFRKQKKLIIEKIAETLYQTEYTYLEYLNHLLTQCVHSTTVEGGCPLSKCKLKSPVGFDQLRLHLVNECTKIMLECEQCKDRLRRPWIEHHDCRRAYAKRLT